MSRGRLIYRFKAKIDRLDTEATSLNPSPNGYNNRTREPATRTDGAETRIYKPSVYVPCQVETEADPWDVQEMRRTGDTRTSRVKLVFHFQWLEDNGLVNKLGKAEFGKGDRLRGIFDRDGRELDDYDQLEMFCTSINPRSYGLSGLRRNLLLATYERRLRSTA